MGSLARGRPTFAPPAFLRNINADAIRNSNSHVDGSVTGHDTFDRTISPTFNEYKVEGYGYYGTASQVPPQSSEVSINIEPEYPPISYVQQYGQQPQFTYIDPAAASLSSGSRSFAAEDQFIDGTPALLPTRIFTGTTRYVRAILTDPQSTVLFITGDDARIRTWDLVSGRLLRISKGHRHPIYSLTIDEKSGTVFSGSIDGSILAHDPRIKEPVAKLNHHTDAVKSLAYNPSTHKLYSAGYDGVLAEWDPRSTTPRILMDGGNDAWLRGLQLSHDGSEAYVADSKSAVKCVDIESGDVIWEYRGETEPVRSLHLDATGTFLYSGGSDGSITQFDAETGELQGSLVSHRGWVTALATHPLQPRRLFSVSVDTTIKEWDLGRGTLTTTFEPKVGPVEGLVMENFGRRCWSFHQDGGVREWRVPEAWWLDVEEEEGDEGQNGQP